MSFINKIKILLGLDVEDESYEYDESASLEPSENPHLTQGPSAPPELELSPDATQQIFTKVIEVFNASLPSFLANSVDPEKQKKELYEALDSSVKEHLETLKAAAESKCRAEWESERQSILANAEALKKKASELEEKSSKIQERKMSAERQKRALNERVRDLETQVMKLEAEKEQFEIESKCMVNKTKAAAVLESEIDELRKENNELRQRHLQNAQSIDESQTLKALEEQSAEIERLKAENEKLATAISEAKLKDDMSVAMLSELQGKASEANENSKELQQRFDALKEELTQKDAQIEDLNHIIKEKDLQLSENEGLGEQIEEIQSQIERFDSIKRKMDERAEKLKASLQSSQAEIESLRQTIKNNLLDHAQEKKRLTEEINTLKRNNTIEFSLNEENATQDDQSTVANELISGTDWLVSTPPKEVSMRVAEDTDFGYQPPARKPKIGHNDAQMSLF